tara:strand:- start:9272 stop:9772 length:501 start_codon:yes stop_codon:yes gene_type:complete
MALIDLKNATILIKDGTAPSLTLEIKIGEGNLQWTERITREYRKDRGNLSTVRNGDEEPMDVSFDFEWEYLKGSATSGAAPTIEEALKQIGNASAWVSTDADLCTPYAVDLEITNEPTAACGDKEVITLADFRWEEFSHDLRGATVSCSGKCNVTSASIVRSVQSA